MSDVFISYARSTQPTAQKVGEALRGLGYSVWLDDQLPAHRAYADVIEERLRAAKSVVVIWSSDAVRSEWVRSEAGLARENRKLVQLRIDQTRLPMPFDQIQCADLSDWTGQSSSLGWRQVTASIAELTRGGSPPDAEPAPDRSADPRSDRGGRRRSPRRAGQRQTASAAELTPEDRLRRTAARKADVEIGLRKQVINYVAVNTGLAAINLVTDPHQLWFQYPLIAWGVGLGIYALSVYQKSHDGREAIIARKLERMRRSDDPPP